MLNLKGLKCPSCKRKGLHYLIHHYDITFRNFNKVKCKFCNSYFNTIDVERFNNNINSEE